MATLKMSSVILNSSAVSAAARQRGLIKAAINISLPGLRSRGGLMAEEMEVKKKQMSPVKIPTTIRRTNDRSDAADPAAMAKLYAVMEAVADRIEMHNNIGDQRADWNRLLLTSINTITLAAATMAVIAAINGGAAVKFSSTAMYAAATGMLSIVNKIQPSQLAEEQRNAVRLFKQIKNQIETLISIGNPTNDDVKEMMERVLALDKAFPLPLLGVMLEKFPAAMEPAVWWPEQRRRRQLKQNSGSNNGWNGKLEEEMKSVAKVLRIKDKEDYIKLGTKALNLNKFLAVTGPVLTGLAAVGSALVDSPTHGGWAAALGVAGGALASVVNTIEHGGQVGMVFEMYRSNAGFFKMVEESIESNLREEEPERRENGEIFELKMGLQLGRSLSELRNLAAMAAAVDREEDIDEFASKLF
ncbi:probable F-box protein At4g22030 [Andrographis paniculata]|uniref:probable F-box protein At4g22030 n=1 Tax=Andrographis paniculata TaxID=175694 RepID=UPI0021E6DF28|nr:probable F-box protein At4g22030 [Andrographis paniculata]